MASFEDKHAGEEKKNGDNFEFPIEIVGKQNLPASWKNSVSVDTDT